MLTRAEPNVNADVSAVADARGELDAPALVPQWVGELAAKAGIAARITEHEGEAVWRGDGVVVASLATARMQRNAAGSALTRPWTCRAGSPLRTLRGCGHSAEARCGRMFAQQSGSGDVRA